MLLHGLLLSGAKDADSIRLWHNDAAHVPGGVHLITAADSPPSLSLGPLALLARLAAELLVVRRRKFRSASGARSSPVSKGLPGLRAGVWQRIEPGQGQIVGAREPLRFPVRLQVEPTVEIYRPPNMAYLDFSRKSEVWV
jgi:hypothetical protein